jgi:hypothetical protein
MIIENEIKLSIQPHRGDISSLQDLSKYHFCNNSPSGLKLKQFITGKPKLNKNRV